MLSFPTASFRPLLLLLGVLVGAGTARPLAAQTDAMERAQLIEAIYPVMIAALEAKQFGRARNICDQVIVWEPQNPVHHYNLACIEAQAGGSRIPYAFGALDLAAALGFSDFEHMQADPDLKPLRDDPRFADLVRRVTHNASASDAIAGIQIPRRPAGSEVKAAPPVDADQPASAEIRSGVPVGLYWMSRYLAGTRTLEQEVWYFAPDATVYRNLETGFSARALADHRGPRGQASAESRQLKVQWQDGTSTAAVLEQDRTGFTWDMGIFSLVASLGDATELAGTYAGGGGVGGSAVIPQRLHLQADGTFQWEGVTFSPAGLLASSTGTTRGRWEPGRFALRLVADSGVAVQRFAFSDDDESTVVKPDRLYFGGEMLRRQP